MEHFSNPWAALEAAAKRWPDAESLVFPHQNARLSFVEWRNRSLAAATALAGAGIKPGEHVALLAENRWEWPVIQLACAAVGAVFVPLNSHYRREDLAFVLAQSEVSAVVCSASYRSNPYLETIELLRGDLPKLRHIFCLDDETGAGLFTDTGQPFTPVAERVGALLYTSGTTGFPKGALLSHHAMMMMAWGASGRLGVGEADRWTSIIPLFHCAGCIMNIQGSMQRGAAYVGVPSFDPETMFKVIEQERCSFLSGVPTSYLAMLEHPSRKHYNLSSLQGGSCGGADANPHILQRCATEFPIPGLSQVYGQTEGATLFVCPAADDPQRFDTAGTALPGYELRIVHPETLQALPPGEIGEIQARGAMVMDGYYSMPDATAETILPGGWLRTGDLGYLREDQHLVIAGGRLRDMIIRGGENIYPAEIENLMQSHEAVETIAVVGVPDEYYGEIVAAVVKLARPVTARELQQACDGRIAKFKVPAKIFRIENFPLTASGKIRKVALRDMISCGDLELLA